jgi:two-component system OmpR family sensor kinase
LYPSIKFEFDYKSFLVKSNKNALERIFDNLLTNACKYNKKNGLVQIIIKENKVIIQDTGIGIKDVEKVFQRYYKENERGLGIGMNIVKNLCEALSIGIGIRSEINIGTTIELRFN